MNNTENDNIENNNNKTLTALQRAKKKYYEKIKNTDDYKQKRSSPETKKIINDASKKYYEKVKNDPEFKRKVSERKKIYYEKKKSGVAKNENLVFFPEIKE